MAWRSCRPTLCPDRDKRNPSRDRGHAPGCYRLRMTSSLMGDAFAHHVWATLRVIDACLELSPEQLETAVPGTYGSILDTMRHTVGADSSYLFVMTGGATPLIDEDHMDLSELRAATEGHGAAWSSLL